MEYKAKFVQRSFNFFKKYLQQHLTHSYHLRPMINYVKNNYVSKDEEGLAGIEIGTHQALNAYSIMQNLPMKALFLIDPYELYDDGINDYTNREKDFKIAEQRMKSYEAKSVFIKQPSEVAHELFLKKMIKEERYLIDFVYIDGAHDYDHVKQDIELYYPLVKHGGIIGGHDFRADCEGLCRAVFEFVDTNDLELNGWTSDWWIVKP